MTRIAISLSLLLALCGFLYAETTAWQGFEQTPEDNWTYQANSIGSGYWGLMDDEFGGASPQSGSQYWASWNMGGFEGIISFANQNLPLGYVYTLSFHYYTRLLSSPTEYSRYCLSYDNGITWEDWIDLLPNTQAWTQVSFEIPVQHRQLMLKVAAKHSGTSKYAHWDSFQLSRVPAPPQAPVIYNLQIAQRTDGSRLVDIYYDLFDANNNPADISLLLSGSGGTSFEISPDPAFLSGDIGPGVPLGSGKHIIWNAGAQGIALEGDQYRFRLLAEDGTTFGTVATPVFDPPGGTYNSPQLVSITSATDGGTIHYTIDGSEPTEASILYMGPISVTEDTTIKAKAFKSGWITSETTLGEYLIWLVPQNFVLVEGGTVAGITVTAFYIDKFETTQASYQSVMGVNPSYYSGNPNRPVEQVSWYNAIEYCNRRSTMEGLNPCYVYQGYGTNPSNWPGNWSGDNGHQSNILCIFNNNGYRLPTSSEWEYTARGGLLTQGYAYCGSNNIYEVSWFEGNNTPYGTKNVGLKLPNELGVYDLGGNVGEWCWDGFEYYRQARGGAWAGSTIECMPTGYLNVPVMSMYYGWGFRTCRGSTIQSNTVFVEGGTFYNGTSNVTLSSFYIDKYETTQVNYLAVMGTNPSYFIDSPYRPVEQVSWFNAIEYCNRRSMQEGLTPCYSYSTYGTNPANWPTGWNTNETYHTNISCSWSANGYRLPTEMEWMFAAKGGTQMHDYIYSGSNDLNLVGWFNGNNNPYGTKSVGGLQANELGLFDMSGNVFEWCWDIYGSYPDGSQNNPTGLSTGASRLLRGGGFVNGSDSCTVFGRNSHVATVNSSTIGLRCVRRAP